METDAHRAKIPEGAASRPKSASKLSWIMGSETPADSPLTLEDVMSLPAYRRLMTPELAPEDPAFPFDLPLLDSDSHSRSGERVRLADLAGERPVALIFGSYT